VIEIALRITRLGEKSISYSYALTCGERDIATIRATAVCCRIPPNQPPVSIRIPAEMYFKLAEYCDPADNQHPLAP
jgi:acyl-CoA thioesterase FadM